MTPALRERAVRFGPRQGLAGILSTPRDARLNGPCVVIVNAGIVHHVGPNRLYVDLARTLASEGYSVLRFDLSGLGDSDAASGGASLSRAALSDISAALDFLEQTRGGTSFIMCGLCSGANHSMLTTFSDTRVVGALLIDPTVARSRRSRVLHLSRRFLHAATWGALITLRHPMLPRALSRQRRMALAQASQDYAERQEITQVTAEQIRVAFEQVIARGVQLMLVFTGGVNHVYNYRDQLFDLMPGLDFRHQLRLEFMPETDHTISDNESRAKLLRAVGDWMARCFPVSETRAVQP
ncbi:MAG: alpha/beta fold hydrolase [Pseudomonadota bacterium]